MSEDTLTGGGRVLLTGATGYIGGRLLRLLEDRGEPVRCLVRRPEALGDDHRTVEIVQGDVLDPDTLGPALRDIDTAYYLVHSMGSPGRFEDEDRRAAHNFAATAQAAGIRRIVYLGGLGAGADLSAHLASRQEVGSILAESGVQVLEFRASIVIGSGSLSFEIMRALVERLPVMITPRWVRSVAQPIAVEDVLAYLVAALDVEVDGNAVFEIGGADRVSYEELMREYARQLGLRRLIVPVPLLTPRLSSLWLGLVTPVYARIGRKLIESLPHETIVRHDTALRAFSIRPRGFREAIARALENENREFAETRWSDAFSSIGLGPERYGGTRFGKRLVDSRSIHVPVGAEQAFRPIRRVGGQTGWYFANSLWHIRGFLDLLVGGVGLRRGRRDPEQLTTGAAVDFWRVEAMEPDRLLRLKAEMKLPGRAWLQFEVQENASGSTIHQTAIFDPVGLFGTAYWYVLFPIHSWLFAGMLRRIGERSRVSLSGDLGERHGRKAPRGEAPRPLHRLECSQLLPLPVDEAFNFFADAHNLERITPPWLHFRIVTPPPVTMGQGTLIDYKLRLRGLPLRWQSEIVEWRPGRGFVDRQIRGPYSHWEHTHTFEQQENGTLMRDLVLYRLPLGPLGALANRAVVKSDLRRIFDYRQDAIVRQLNRNAPSPRPTADA